MEMIEDNSDLFLDTKLTPLEREICEKKADLVPNNAIAISLGIKPSQVTAILAKDHIQKFTNALIVSRNKASFASKALRVKLLSDIIEDKLAVMEEKGIRLADSTCKDVVDLTNTIDYILKEEEKVSLGANKTDVYFTIMQAVMDK